MPFYLIPLLLALASVGGIAYIVLRKSGKLTELASQSLDGPTAGLWKGLASEMWPEFVYWFKEGKFQEYKENALIETEKLLRRLRLASMKFDRTFDSMIKKIRTKTADDEVKFPKEAEQPSADSTLVGPTVTVEKQALSKDELKKSEQKIIMEIAKNPKNPLLYEELGDLYVKLGEFTDAKESFEAAIELSQNKDALQKKLSRVLEKIVKLEGETSQN